MIDFRPTLPLMCMLAAWLCMMSHVEAGASLDDALAAYRDGDLQTARRIATEYADAPLAQLVLHLCQVFDAKHQDLRAGLDGLKSLIDHCRHDPFVWAEASLVYCRSIHVLRSWGRHMEFHDADIRRILEDVVARFPHASWGCQAVITLADTYFARAHDRRRDRGLTIVEDFLNAYRGDPVHTVPVHIFVESYYINLRGDYRKSFEHLKAAYDIGIVNEVLKRNTLFRLGRVNDIKLGDADRAREYYEEFLRLFPNSDKTPLIRRYLKRMGGT